MQAKLLALSEKWSNLSKEIMKDPRTKNVIGFAVAGLLCAAIWSFGQSASPDPGLPGRVAVWHAEGSAEDASGQGNNGTASAVGYAPGVHGQAFELDGKSACIATLVDTHPDNKPFMTWSAWVLPRKLAGNRQILTSYWDGWDRSLTIQDGGYSIYVGGDIWRTGEGADAGVWQHVAVTFAPDEIRFYKNGIETYHKHVAGRNGPVAPLYIGRNPRVQEFFGGLIDEVEIFDRALDDEEVGNLYEKYSKQAGSITPEAVEGADEPEEATGIAQAELTPINGPDGPEPVVEAPATEKSPEPVTPTPAPVMEQIAATPAATAAEKGTAYVASSAESPTVAAAIQANDPEALAKAINKERWDNPIEALPVDFILKKTGANTAAENCWWAAQVQQSQSGSKNPQKTIKLSDFKGKPLMLVFFVVRPDIAALEYSQQIINSYGGETGRINVVLVTPNTPEEIKTRLANLGVNLPVIYDPEDEIRRQLGIYSTPLVLLDPSGQILWKCRMGQRVSPETDGVKKVVDAGDLFDVVSRVTNGKYSTKTEPPPLGAGKDTERKLYDFETGAEGWTLIGNSWGNKPTSENHLPGLTKGFHGRYWLSSFAGPLSAGTGIAISPEFEIKSRYLHLVVGGGDLHQWEGIALVCGGTTIKTTTGLNTFELNPVTWDLKNFRGKKARIIAYDAGKTEQRDGIMLDCITASDSPLSPTFFSNLHDPNNPDHVARVTKDLPEEWLAIQNGDFHISATPAKTYEMEIAFEVKTEDKARSYYLEMESLPNTIGQTVHEDYFEAGNGKGMIRSIPGKTGKAFRPEKQTVEVRVVDTTKKTFEIRRRVTITPNILRLERGANADFAPLPAEQVKLATRSEEKDDVYNEAGGTEILKKEGLIRFSNETDSAFLLRCYRWMQRTWVDGEVWGGWPIKTKSLSANLASLEYRAVSCPAVGSIVLMIGRAGIPTLTGQGHWANEAGVPCTPHVRALIFLNKVGWIQIDDGKELSSRFGQFAFGTTWGDNYTQEINDLSPLYPKPKRVNTVKWTPPENALPGYQLSDMWTCKKSESKLPFNKKE